MSRLFEPYKLRDITLRNRVVVSPMCQYSAAEGSPSDWHCVHLGSRAIGGAGLVIAEASAVEARGRISPGDTGLYRDEHIAAWAPITHFIKDAGAVAGIQLAHAGRKASCALPWEGGHGITPEQGGWAPIVAPSALAFDDNSATPRALATSELPDLIASFALAAQRALAAGFEVIELHGAHGYLLHEFMSPISNQRSDAYGGSFDNRIRLTLDVIAAVRAVWPERLPLLLRISATDWLDSGGWDIEQSIELARRVKTLGVDLIDVSSGGNVPKVKIPVGPGYQVPLSTRIRREADIATGAVGMITEAHQAQTIIEQGDADLVLLARELLRDPYWPMHAAKILGAEIKAPVQYGRAW
jgi:2,4-dienoyl-CoA reductase-like NADH-dependent reductase (Old Yellow Enzyme family)